MPNITAPALVYPSKSFPGQTTGAPSGLVGEVVLSQLLGKYSHLVKAGKVFTAYATLAASSPTIFSTNTLTGGPFVFNPVGSGVDAHVLAMGVCVSTAASTGTAGAVGLTWGNTTTPTATTAIDAIANNLMGGGSSGMTVFRTATPSVAGGAFLPLVNVSLAAVTAMFAPTYVDVDGAVVCPPGNFVSVAASSTQTNLVAKIALMWAELPN